MVKSVSYSLYLWLMDLVLMLDTLDHLPNEATYPVFLEEWSCDVVVGCAGLASIVIHSSYFSRAARVWLEYGLSEILSEIHLGVLVHFGVQRVLEWIKNIDWNQIIETRYRRKIDCCWHWWWWKIHWKCQFYPMGILVAIFATLCFVFMFFVGILCSGRVDGIITRSSERVAHSTTRTLELAERSTINVDTIERTSWDMPSLHKSFATGTVKSKFFYWRSRR